MSQGVSARDAGLARCHACALVCRVDSRDSRDSRDARNAPDALLSCPRCGTPVESRKAESLARTWALLAAAYVLYVPANVLPIMRTRTVFGEQNDTILSGIVYLWNGGSWGLALIVFCASIVVPLVKLFALTFLVISVRIRSAQGLVQRTRLFRAVDFVGRWSMLDVYVLALLTALVQTPAVAQIRPGPAALAFASVVVLTLLAARSFDVRLLWDAAAAARTQGESATVQPPGTALSGEPR